MIEQRFVVRELTGYNITAASASNEAHHKARPVTDVAVYDAWHCYRVVASYPARRGYGHDLRNRRRKALRQARSLNRAHERWLRGCVA